jgi:hypothetical protein
VDLRRALSLQSALRSAALAISEESAPMASDAMLNSYRKLRREVRSVIPEDDVEELDRLFPEGITARGRTREELDTARFFAARSALQQLAGWLDGYAQVVQIEANAEAYADARLKEAGIRP